MKIPSQSSPVIRHGVYVGKVDAGSVYPQQRAFVELIPQLYDWKCTINGATIPCSLLRWVFNYQPGIDFP
jgi:hypothetical protein